MSGQTNADKAITLFFLEDDREMSDHLYDIVARAKIEMGDRIKTAWSAMNLADTEYRLDFEPNIEVFTHLLFDLDVGHYKTRRDGKTISYGEETGYAGLDYILDAYAFNPAFRSMLAAGRVAIYTGHDIEFLQHFMPKNFDIPKKDVENVYRYLQGRCFPKLSKDPNGAILKWLKEN